MVKIYNSFFRLFFQSVLITTTCIWLCSCSEQPQQVTISLGDFHSPLASLVLLTEDLGYFEQQGINLKMHDYPSGKRALAALLNGEEELVTVAETPFVIASFKHKDLRLYASMGRSSNEMRILARRDHGIKQPRDLKTKSIGAQKGSAIHFFLSSFLLYHKIQPAHADIHFMKVEELPKALINGDIDAISIREPFLSEARTAIGVNKTIEFNVPGLYTKTYNLVANKDFVNKYPGAMEKILRAMNKATNYAEQHPQQALTTIAEKLQLPAERIAKFWQDTRLRLTLNQGLLSILNEQARWAVNSNLIKKNWHPNGQIPDFINNIDTTPLTNSVPYAVSLTRTATK
jgi:sulfonate transport system substrate-binding protein